MNKIINFIKTATTKQGYYDTIRSMLIELDKVGRYPEDYQIKELQRLADYHYELLEE